MDASKTFPVCTNCFSAKIKKETDSAPILKNAKWTCKECGTESTGIVRVDKGTYEIQKGPIVKLTKHGLKTLRENQE